MYKELLISKLSVGLNEEDVKIFQKAAGLCEGIGDSTLKDVLTELREGGVEFMKSFIAEVTGATDELEEEKKVVAAKVALDPEQDGFAKVSAKEPDADNKKAKEPDADDTENDNKGVDYKKYTDDQKSVGVYSEEVGDDEDEEDLDSLFEEFDALDEEMLSEYSYAGLSTGQKQGAIIAAGAAVAATGAAAGIRALYRKAHGVTHEQVKACNGDPKCIKTAYIAGARKKISLLQGAKGKDSKNAAKYDAKIAKLNGHVSKWSKSNEVARANIARSHTNEEFENNKYNLITVKEDIDALFNGETLSEEFRQKAETIFESAINRRVEEYKTQIDEEVETRVAEGVETFSEELTTQIDGYLNYIVEEWYEDNKIAVESGLRNEITEEFISGLKKLFAESYIEVPEGKEDLVVTLTQEKELVEEEYESAVQKNIELINEIKDLKKEKLITELSEGLVDTDKDKFVNLAESVSYEDELTYTGKLEQLKESYISRKVAKKASPIDESPLLVEEKQPVKDKKMQHYVDGISRFVK